MLRWHSRQEGLRPLHTRASCALRWPSCIPVLGLLGYLSSLAAAPPQPSTVTSAGFLSGLALGCFLLFIVAFLARSRLNVAKRDLQKSRELANHREYERNLAQQELVRRLEEERELAKEKMQFDSKLAEYEKYASLAQLALGAAHEINNPLLGIMSHLELEWKSTSGEQRVEIEQCVEGARRISSAVRGLLDYARPGPLLLGKVNLFKLVAETLKFVEHQPMFRHITLANRVPLDLPSVTADVNQLSQIIMNLLLNAAQATLAGGNITISAGMEQSAHIIELCVRDSGSGIPADILPHVFEPFFSTKRGKGTGLGLSISQSYVRSHGGDIHLESTPGAGTTVRVTLPVLQPGQVATGYQEVIA
jgi:signal transduction histidine kinase